jgi:hypothetical protein
MWPQLSNSDTSSCSVVIGERLWTLTVQISRSSSSTSIIVGWELIRNFEPIRTANNIRYLNLEDFIIIFFSSVRGSNHHSQFNCSECKAAYESSKNMWLDCSELVVGRGVQVALSVVTILLLQINFETLNDITIPERVDCKCDSINWNPE